MNLHIFINIFLIYELCSVRGLTYKDKASFLHDFIERNVRPGTVVSLLQLRPDEKTTYTRELSSTYRFAAFQSQVGDSSLHDIYLGNLNEEPTNKIMQDQEYLKSPVRWMLFYNIESEAVTTLNTSRDLTFHHEYIYQARLDVTDKLASVYTALDTEIYIALERKEFLHLYLVHKLREKMPLIWEECGVWNKRRGFDRAPHKDVLAMRRRNLQRIEMVAAAFMLNNSTLEDMPLFRNTHVDTIPKFTYYMTVHLFDWLNVTGIINRTSSFGYEQADGSFDGMVREVADGRAEFCAVVLYPLESRKRYIHFVVSPTKVHVSFLFKKPPLASVADIYSLPFSRGVWISIAILILMSTLALLATTLWEMIITKNPTLQMTLSQRLSQNFHDSLGFVFQQGFSHEFYSSSARQVVYAGLMSFMFLYTAYSANVILLLQSSSNDINSVETLLKSPLQCGAEDIGYNRWLFDSDTRPLYRAFWMKKAAPQGDDFFVPIEKGIKRVRKGLYAFHVEKTGAFHYIQKTYLEHEKCNIAEIKYFTFADPHMTASKKSTSKEQFRIGILRIVESGLQSRSNRRLSPGRPNCGSGAATFTPVSIYDVAPIYKNLTIIYIIGFVIFGLEVYAYRREKQIERKKFVVE